MDGFNGAAPARARNDHSTGCVPVSACDASTGPRPRGRGMELTGTRSRQSYASTGPRPRGRGMRAGFPRPAPVSLQRGRARAGAEWTCAPSSRPSRIASTGPRPRGRGMFSLVTLSGASSQQLNCDCLRPLRFHSLPAVDLSHTIRSISSVYVMRAPAGFSASPRRSRVQLSKNIKVSDHITRRVQLHIGQSQCCDYPIPSPLRRSQPNKNYLILIVVDDFGQS